MTERLRDALNTLAERGEPRGADAVLAAARTSAAQSGATQPGTRRWWPLAVAAAVVVVAVGLVAVLGGDDVVDVDVVDPPGTRGPVSGLLEVLPEGDYTGVGFMDFAAVAGQAGVEVPAPGSPAIEVARYWEAMTSVVSARMLNPLSFRLEDPPDRVRALFGFDQSDITGLASAGAGVDDPFDALEVFVGRFEPDRVAEALVARGAERAGTHGGAVLVRWESIGFDFTQEPPAFAGPKFIRPGVLAVRADRLVIARTRDEAVAALDATPSRSLGRDDRFAVLAGRADQLHLLVGGLNVALPELDTDQLIGLAQGAGVTDDTAYLGLAFEHTTESAARAAEPFLRANAQGEDDPHPDAGHHRLVRTHVERDGRAVLVELHLPDADQLSAVNPFRTLRLDRLYDQ